MKIQLIIERLILDGIDLPAAQRPQLQAVIETELSRLLIAGGLRHELSRSGATPHLHMTDMRLTAGSPPTQLGRQIAASIYSGIGTQEKAR